VYFFYFNPKTLNQEKITKKVLINNQ